MKILNLYAGIGGNRKLWGDNHEVTAVENDEDIAKVYNELFPNDVVFAGHDAHDYLIKMFNAYDFIWSSPPCPSHSRMRTSLVKSPHVYPDMKLYEEIIFLKHFCKVPWVVENVIPYYEPLIKPTVTIDRHHFWSNFNIPPLELPRNYKGRVTDQPKEVLAKEYGIVLPEGTKNQRKLLRNAVRPEVGLHILESATILEGSEDE